MSEHAPQHEQHEKFVAKEETEPRREAAPEHQPRHEQEQPSVEKLAHHAKQEAVVAKELVSHEKGRTPQSELFVTQELKQQTWNRGITRIRKHLSTPSRAFSKVIHQPVVDSVSRVSEKTVARPSGLLTGAICAFIGSSAFLWIARHYGFTYNYFLFVLFFAGGFIVGLIIEAFMSLLRKSKA
jgi:hypothetical protein